jgi:hypothetical protein
MATPKYRRDAALKALERVLSHPALSDGLPVRFRCDPSLTTPAVRCTRFALSVWLPTSLAPCIPLLARFVRSLRHKPTVTIVVRANSHRTPTNGTVATAKPTPLKPILWQREWERLWDEVAAMLFQSPADAK